MKKGPKTCIFRVFLRVLTYRPKDLDQVLFQSKYSEIWKTYFVFSIIIYIQNK